MKFRFHPEALAEYADAALYYSDRVPGLGADFANEIEAGIASITADPMRSPVTEDDVRRYLVRRFPYGILYSIDGDHVLIFIFEPDAQIRFSQSPSGGGPTAAKDGHNPAWDFQYLLPKYEVKRDYRFRARLAYRPRCGREEILKEVAAWRQALK